ncbi:MAG: putative vancomycin resistance protein [Chthonomonadaceae bacterium]|nr:putative vancomycin resistance protein [Chthonomonadaceae bacterium]
MITSEVYLNVSVTSTLSQPARRSPVRRIVLLTSLLVAGLSAAAIGVMAHVPDDQIAPGVHVGRLDLGGKSLQEARSALEHWAETQQSTTLNLHFAADAGITKSWSPTAAKLGLGINVPATLDAASKVGHDSALGQVSHWIGGGKVLPVAAVPAVDDAKLRVYLTNQVAQDIYRPAKRAQLLPTKGGGFGLHHEVNGITLDKDASAQNVAQSWSRYLSVATAPPAAPASGAQTPGTASPDNTAAAPTHDTPAAADAPEAILTPKLMAPELTAADLEQIDGKIAEFSTYYTGIANRRSNIVLAAHRIDGTLLKAGEVFSYNKVVGPRISAAGFKQAPQYVHGKHVMGEGGGICQVSSTLFNAALVGALKIVQRQNHSMPVGYLHHGRDATAAYGNIDMQFQNDTSAPIYIRSSTSGGVLNFTLWGKRTPGREVTLVKGKEVNLGSPVETHPDSHIAAGRRIVEERGSPGISVTWTRIIKDNGQVVKREAFHSHYTAFPTIVAVGTRGAKKPTPKPAGVVPGAVPTTVPTNPPSAPPAHAPGQ